MIDRIQQRAALQNTEGYRVPLKEFGAPLWLIQGRFRVDDS